MTGHRSNWLVAYDISSDRERSRVDRVLKAWGFRVQKSVWTVLTGRAGIGRLHQELDGLKIETGQVLFFRLYGEEPPLAIGRPCENRDGELAYFL